MQRPESRAELHAPSALLPEAVGSKSQFNSSKYYLIYYSVNNSESSEAILISESIKIKKEENMRMIME